MIDDPNKSGEWKIHLTIKLKFMSSVDGMKNVQGILKVIVA